MQDVYTVGGFGKFAFFVQPMIPVVFKDSFTEVEYIEEKTRKQLLGKNYAEVIYGYHAKIKVTIKSLRGQDEYNKLLMLLRIKNATQFGIYPDYNENFPLAGSVRFYNVSMDGSWSPKKILQWIEAGQILELGFTTNELLPRIPEVISDPQSLVSGGFINANTMTTVAVKYQ